jgi:hypothetical protein
VFDLALVVGGIVPGCGLSCVKELLRSSLCLGRIPARQNIATVKRKNKISFITIISSNVI